MNAYKSCAFLVSLVILILLQATSNANSSLKKPKDSCNTVQYFYGSAKSKVLMGKLSQMEKKIDQKLNELEKKVDLCFSGRSGSSCGKGRNKTILHCSFY